MEQKIKALYLKYGKDKTYQHALNVGRLAKKMAPKYDLDARACFLAGLLHDISAILTPKQMMEAALSLNYTLDPSEIKYPFLLHQRLSKEICSSYFKIEDERILSSVGCHTTLKKAPSSYDCLIFLADKMAWDQEGQPPYLDGLVKALELSLENACLFFITEQLEKGRILLAHQWLVEAKAYLENDIILQWDKVAKDYQKHQEQALYEKRNREVVEERFKDLSKQTVLDMGCGYGYYTQYFQSIGADVVGIDGSSQMITLAKKSYPNCQFRKMNILKPIAFDDETFDLIFINQVLMDLEDIDVVFRECFRLLKKGGTLYYGIVHPAFYDGVWLENKHAKYLERYLSTYSFNNNFWGQTKHFHRPLSVYLNTASKYCFYLKEVDEPVVYEKTNKNVEIPLFFFAEYKKLDKGVEV